MTSNQPPVTLLILAWNRWYLTERCLESLQRTDLDGAQVLVIDNGSRDGTPEKLENYPWVERLCLPENVNFVRGNNEGIRASSPRSDIVLLNNDVEFDQHDWLTRLRDCANGAPDIGIVGARLVQKDGRLLHAGTYILPDTTWGQQIGSGQRDVGQYCSRRDVEGIVFACAYIRRSLIDTIGYLSTDYRSYFEDTDYCLRARQHGFRVLVCGDVTLRHNEHGSSGGDTTGMMKQFETSRRVFRRIWRRRLESRYDQRLLWQSILNFPTGYAMSARELLIALDEAGTRVAYRYVYGPGSVFGIEESQQFDDHRLNVFARRRTGLRVPISVVFGQGDVFRLNAGRYKVGFTMTEVDAFPAEWVRQGNRLDEVWVPTQFLRQAFLSSGLRVPVHVVPLGVNTDYFHPRLHAFRNPEGDFTFLSVFEWGERKEPWGLLRSFNQEFRADEPVRLVCKINNRDPSIDLRREIELLGLDPGGGRISAIVNEEIPRSEMGALYVSCDCFVSPSRGEGWNMPLMEAMACALPSIATDWGGQTEFMNARVAYPLAIRGTVPAVAKCPYYEGFHWADPDLEHLRHLMRHVYENRDEAREKGRRAAEWVAREWTWSRSASTIRARLAQAG